MTHWMLQSTTLGSEDFGIESYVATVEGMAPPKKERCPEGHEYSPDNSYHHPTKGGRVCRECHRTQARESARRRAALRKTTRVIAGSRDEEGRWEPKLPPAPQPEYAGFPVGNPVSNPVGNVATEPATTPAHTPA